MSTLTQIVALVCATIIILAVLDTVDKRPNKKNKNKDETENKK